MNSLRKPLFLLLCLSGALAAPVFNPNALLPRHESRIIARQDQVTQPVSFKTVTTTDTQVGSITQTCDVTLTPITGQDGAALVREDKSCTFVVVPTGGSAPPPENNDPGSDNTAPPPDQATTTTDGQGQATTTAGDPNATTTGGDQSAPPDTATFETSVVGTATDVPGGAQSSGATTSADASATASAPPPPISVIGTATIPAESAVVTPSSGGTDTAATTTTAAPSLSTQSDGAVVTIPATAAQAQESTQQQEVPGRKLEVLPIGLGVFAGISVIALIVVGLVTYERTKYRKAFRQRKLAEAGANMGYGGMAERT